MIIDECIDKRDIPLDIKKRLPFLTEEKMFKNDIDLYLNLTHRGCRQNPGPNRLLLGGLQCIRMKRESMQ